MSSGGLSAALSSTTDEAQYLHHELALAAADINTISIQDRKNQTLQATLLAPFDCDDRPCMCSAVRASMCFGLGSGTHFYLFGQPRPNEVLRSELMAKLDKEVKSLDDDSWMFDGPRSRINLISRPGGLRHRHTLISARHDMAPEK